MNVLHNRIELLLYHASVLDTLALPWQPLTSVSSYAASVVCVSPAAFHVVEVPLLPEENVLIAGWIDVLLHVLTEGPLEDGKNGSLGEISFSISSDSTSISMSP